MRLGNIFFPYVPIASLTATIVSFGVLVASIIILFAQVFQVYQFLIFVPFPLLLMRYMEASASSRKPSIVSKRQLLSKCNFVFANAFVLLAIVAAIYVMVGLFFFNQRL